MHTLAGGDVLKIPEVTRLNVLEVFTFMMYEADVKAAESVNTNEHP